VAAVGGTMDGRSMDYDGDLYEAVAVGRRIGSELEVFGHNGGAACAEDLAVEHQVHRSCLPGMTHDVKIVLEDGQPVLCICARKA
jgi:hypothetical protein